MITVVILNSANGVYQNSLYGLVAAFPSQYTNAVVLGTNICGTFVSIINIITLLVASDVKIAALLYFLISFLTILACFLSIFLLPKFEFYNFYMEKAKKRDEHNEVDGIKYIEAEVIPKIDGVKLTAEGDKVEVLDSGFMAKLHLYYRIFKKVWIQCVNVWCVFFVTLALFPAVMADVKYSSKTGKYDFFIPEFLFTAFTTYLLFNFLAALGSFLANFVQWPSAKWLVVPVVVRFAFIPLIMFCNYRPGFRTWGVLFDNVWVYILMASIMSITSGYFSSLAMMYAPRYYPF
ncbi:unnamed protein product [Gongylonema pulchrum]|uniref:Equilibrative nucleoside transporter 1 n=1 Tax=Gongylonema pulchrum TaxID=637853 RepID=A0A183CWZ0_9BILA|nr:unnamed protein product [Gongylonema pulchrum]